MTEAEIQQRPQEALDAAKAAGREIRPYIQNAINEIMRRLYQSGASPQTVASAISAILAYLASPGGPFSGVFAGRWLANAIERRRFAFGGGKFGENGGNDFSVFWIVWAQSYLVEIETRSDLVTTTRPDGEKQPFFIDRHRIQPPILRKLASCHSSLRISRLLMARRYVESNYDFCRT